MICPDCQFECSDGTVFCPGCGANFTSSNKAAKPGNRVARRAAALLGWIAFTGVGCFALLALILERGNQPEVPVEQASAVVTPPPEAAPQTTPPKLGSAQRNAAPRDLLEQATPQQWQATSFAARLTFAANYLTPRARFHSTADLKNAGVWLETCISKAVGRNPASTAGQAAAACFSELLRPRRLLAPPPVSPSPPG